MPVFSGLHGKMAWHSIIKERWGEGEGAEFTFSLTSLGYLGVIVIAMSSWQEEIQKMKHRNVIWMEIKI